MFFDREYIICIREENPIFGHIKCFDNIATATN